jgi:hypothetical protein
MGFVTRDGKLLAELATQIHKQSVDREFEESFDASPPKKPKLSTADTRSKDDPAAGPSGVNTKAGPANKYLKPFDMKSFSSIWASKG